MANASLRLVRAEEVVREVTPAAADGSAPAVNKTVYVYTFKATAGGALALENTDLTFETEDAATATAYPLGQDYVVEVRPSAAGGAGVRGEIGGLGLENILAAKK